MEIYDLKSNQIYFNKAEDTFNDLKAIYSIVGTYLRLKNNGNVYIIGLLAYDKNDVGLFNPNFFLKKVSFTSLDIKNISPSISSKRVSCSGSKMVSCYETLNNYIVCFYHLYHVMIKQIN